MAAAASKDRIKEETVRKSVKALLKWREKHHSQSNHEEDEFGEEEDEGDDFIYLSITLKEVPPKGLTLTPHRIPLRHSLLDHSIPNICLIVDGKRITHEAAQKAIQAHDTPFITQVLRLSKLKSDYKSFDSKKRLFDSFDAFFAVKSVVPLLPRVLGKVFYRKKRKVPVPLDLKYDCGNWKEEIEGACNSSLLCLSGGTCSLVRVGRWGVTEREEIVENVFEAVDGVLRIFQEKWGWIRCFHLKFSNSLALPIYEYQEVLQNGDDGLVGEKRKRSLLEQVLVERIDRG